MPLVEAGQSLEINDRWKIVDKMEMVTQYTFAGDFTGMPISHDTSIDLLPKICSQLKRLIKLWRKSQSSMEVGLLYFSFHLARRLKIFFLDDWFVIALTDANFARYNITAEDLQRAMNKNPKVHTALICIGEGAEASW